MSDEPLGELIGSAQGALRAVPTTTDFLAKHALISQARVQATCALAVAVEDLALSIGRLVDVITEGNDTA